MLDLPTIEGLAPTADRASIVSFGGIRTVRLGR